SLLLLISMKEVVCLFFMRQGVASDIVQYTVQLSFRPSVRFRCAHDGLFRLTETCRQRPPLALHLTDVLHQHGQFQFRAQLIHVFELLGRLVLSRSEAPCLWC
ncbi:MAG: hypothetical protein ACK56I_17635, partial [bacterium]